MNLNRIARCMIVASVVAVCFYSLPPPASFGKELPLLVGVSELKSDTERYDRRRVAIMGTVSSCEEKRGRMGSRYTEIQIVQEGELILALSDRSRCAKAGTRVIVQGSYRYSGWFAGYLFSEYLDTEHVVYG